MSGSTWLVTKAAVSTAGGVVAAQSRAAAEIGSEVLRDGGNAVDAAVATSLALAVLEPWMSGLGGGGVMLVHEAATGTTTALDFGMVAPSRLDPQAYPLGEGSGGDLFGWPPVVGDRNLHGPLSIAVPGQLKGLALALERFGTRPFAELAAPAASLARDGLPLDWYGQLQIAGSARDLRRYSEAAAIWLPDGLPPDADSDDGTTRLALGRLADTLDALIADGPDTLYRGDVATALIGDLAAQGCPLTAADLEAYEARFGEPLWHEEPAARFALMPGLYAGASFARARVLLPTAARTGDLPGPAAFSGYAERSRHGLR